VQDHPGLKEVLDLCFIIDHQKRPSVQEILQHEFFSQQLQGTKMNFFSEGSKTPAWSTIKINQQLNQVLTFKNDEIDKESGIFPFKLILYRKSQYESNKKKLFNA